MLSTHPHETFLKRLQQGRHDLVHPRVDSMLSGRVDSMLSDLPTRTLPVDPNPVRLIYSLRS